MYHINMWSTKKICNHAAVTFSFRR